MRVGIIQSCYVPWRGYFDFINSVDLFVVFDDVQYPVGRSWRNRNQIKTRAGTAWITVPVASRSERMPIDQVTIAVTDKPWAVTHRNVLKENLGAAPFFAHAIALWEEGIATGEQYISRLNVRLLRAICQYLGVTTPIVLARDYNATGAKTERLINLLKSVGAGTYLSGPSAKGYLDEEQFRRHRIGLEYKSYDYPPYPQLWGPFAGAVSVLDLIANCGPESRAFIKSSTPDQVAVPCAN
jgi:hypothetical protein